jgi:uncharacterized membrane protein YfcA
VTGGVPAVDLGIAAVVAGAAGVINSIAGGGSLLLFPTLVGLGLPTVTANVTNSITQWPSYLGGVVGFRTVLAGHRRRLLSLSVVALAGGGAGSVLLLTTPSAAFDGVVPVLVLLASVLLAAQPHVAKRMRQPEDGQTRDRAWLYVAVFAGTVYGGYFGGALGVILVGILSLGLGRLQLANAIKTVLSLATASIAALVFGFFGPVSWIYLAVCAPASLAGGLVGARIATRIPSTPLRIFIVTFGVMVAVYFFLRL